MLLVRPRSALGDSFDQSTLPVAASTHTSARLLLSSDAVWRKTLPLDTIGDELPRPGIGVFQRASFGAEVDGDVRVARGAEPFRPAEAGPVGGEQGWERRARRLRSASRREYMAGRRFQGGGGAGSGEDYRGKRGRCHTKLNPADGRAARRAVEWSDSLLLLFFLWSAVIHHRFCFLFWKGVP